VGKIINYFCGGNTARGFHSLFDSNLQHLDRVFILKGGPGTGKSTLMKDIGKRWEDQDYDVEYLYCSSDPESLDGVIIPSLKVGIVDGTAPHIIEPQMPGAIEEYVNLGEAWDSSTLSFHKGIIRDLNKQISECFQNAYNTFSEALKVHDEWEKIYIESMDFEKADQLTKRMLDSFYGKMNLNKKATVYHRFLGAATPYGSVDFIPNLTADIPKRYFIKGRPGSGKSTMLKKIVAEGEKRGFDLEVYHCGFDPNSLDMVISRELGLAIFDSTAPHEYFPSRDGDEIVDMYETVIASGTDEIFAEQIEEISGRYRERVTAATNCLNKAKSWRDELESIYIKAMDFSVVDRHKEDIHEKITQIAEQQ
jgi:Cdc6-like AAA superfamily ATPase